LYPFVDNLIGESYEAIWGKEPTIDSPHLPYVSYTTIPPEEYYKLVEGEKRNPIGPKRYEKSNAAYFTPRDIPRNDPFLIQVIEELGKQANGKYSLLKIIDIPDDVDWEIEEYDDWEWVAEKHRRWE